MPEAWFIIENGRKVGPVASNHLEQMVVAGRIRADTPIWRDGLADWFPAGGVSDLPGRQALATTSSPAVPTRSSHHAPPPPPDGDIAWSGPAFAALIIVTLVIPLVGLIVGPIGMTKSPTRGQGISLLVIALVMFLIYFSALF